MSEGSWQRAARAAMDELGWSKASPSATSSARAHAQLTPDQVEQTIGAAMVGLLLRPLWVHRRVELIRFVDAGTVHRQMSVDFTLPDDRATAAMQRLRPRVVPLAMLKKRDLSRFSMWDEEGRRLPMYTTEQNAWYAGAALVTLARVAASEKEIDPSSVPEGVLEAFRRIASHPAAEAELVLDCLEEGVNPHAGRLANLGDLAPASGHKLQELAQWPLQDILEALRPHGDLSRTLLESPGLNHIARQLAGQFIVLTELNGDANARRIVKFSYEEPPSSYRPSLPFYLQPVRPARSVLDMLSWWHKAITLDSVPVGTARSYHVEVEAPDDIEFVGARLTAEDPGRDDDEPIRARSTDTERQRVHLKVSNAPRAVNGPVWVGIRAARAGFVRSALVLSIAIAALLWLGEEQLDVISTEAEAPAALLLSIPTLLAAFLIRPGEHEMATRLLFGVRALLAGAAGCALVAAGAIAGRYGLETQKEVWSISKWIAVGISGAMLLSYFMPYVTPWCSRATSWAYDRMKD